MRMQNTKTFESYHKKLIISGKPLRLSPHQIAITIAFAENTPSADTITDSANNFLYCGFEAGDTISVTGSTSNDKIYTIATVVAGTITLVATDDLTDEIAGDEVTITKINPANNQPMGFDIPDGVQISIKAFSDNTGEVTIGKSSAKALNTSVKNYRLINYESYPLQIKNTSNIWFDSTVSGDKIMIIHEI